MSETPLTSLSYNPEEPYLLAATFADGVIKMMDRRMDDEEGIVMARKEQHTWIQSGRWQRSSRRDFMTAR